MPSKQDKARKELMRTHGHKYKRHFLSEGYYCFYCGDPANTLDHVPPLHEMPNLPYEKRKRIVSLPLYCRAAPSAIVLWAVVG